MPFPREEKVFTVTVHFSFFSISGWGIDLDYCDVEWFALVTTKIIVVFKIAPKYCILDSY